MADHISADLIWEITRTNSSYIVKRAQAGGVQFSRDPLNLTNKHSRKHAGFANDKAFGIQPGEKGGVTLTQKKAGKKHQPGAHHQTSAYGKNSSGPKVYHSIVKSTAKRSYRPDLRADAVARASAIKRSQRPVKETPEAKPRGAKAKAAAEKK